MFEVRGFRAMPPTNRALHRQAILMLLLANVFWGVSFPVVKAMTLLHGQLLAGAGACGGDL